MDIKDFLNSVLCQFGWRPAMNQKKVFATAWHPGGARAILPVIKRLIKNNLVEVVVLGHEFSEPIFAEAGIAFKTIKDFGLQDISAQSMEQLLKTISPNLVFLGTGSQEGKKNDIIEQTTTVAARKLGIPSLAVLDYWANYSQRFSDERTGKKLDVLPDKIAIMDDVAMEDMLEEGFPKDVLVITGNPYFDSFAEKGKSFTEKNRRAVRNEFGQGTMLVCLACNVFSQWKTTNGYWDLDVVKLVCEFFSQYNYIYVAVRLHPRMPEADRAQIEDAILSLSGGRVKIVKDIDTQTLCLAADLTIVEDSTVGIEAVLMKKPCISLQPGLLIKDSLIVSKMGIIPTAYYTEEQCKALLFSAVNSADNRKEIVDKYVKFIEPDATGGVLGLVYLML